MEETLKNLTQGQFEELLKTKNDKGLILRNELMDITSPEELRIITKFFWFTLDEAMIIYNLFLNS